MGILFLSLIIGLAASPRKKTYESTYEEEEEEVIEMEFIYPNLTDYSRSKNPEYIKEKECWENLEPDYEMEGVYIWYNDKNPLWESDQGRTLV